MSSRPTKDEIATAKKETYFSIAVTFIVGLIIAIFTFNAWNPTEGEEKSDGKK